MSIEQNAFEIERRVVLLKPTTTMPDNTQLGFDGNPNEISTPATDGEFLVYNAPEGTFYMNGNGVMFNKKVGGAGGAWVEGLGGGGDTVDFEGGDTQWRLNLVDNELRFERNDAYDASLPEDAVQAENWVSYASVGGSLKSDALILSEPHFIGALVNGDDGQPRYQNIVSFTSDQEMVFGSSELQTVINTASDTHVERAGVVKRLYPIEPREYDPADEVEVEVRRDGTDGALESLSYTGTVQTDSGVGWLRIHALDYRITDLINPDPDGHVNVRIQVETKGEEVVLYNVKMSSLDFNGAGLHFSLTDNEFMPINPKFEHRQGSRVRVTLTPMRGQGFKIAGAMFPEKDWDDDSDTTEFKPWVRQMAEQFEHFDMIDESNAKEVIGRSTNTILDDGVNVLGADGYHYRAATAGQHGDARNVDLGNFNEETSILSGEKGVYHIYVDDTESVRLWSDADRARLTDGLQATVYRDLEYLEIDLERNLTDSIRLEDVDLVRIMHLEVDYNLLDEEDAMDYYRAGLWRKASNQLMFENITEFEFIDNIVGSGAFYLEDGTDREFRKLHPPQPFTFQDLEGDSQASGAEKARARRILRWWFHKPVRVWGMETTPGDPETFVPSFRVNAIPLKRERVMTEGTVLDTVLGSIGEIEYRQAQDEDMPTLHTRHKLALANHQNEWLFFADALTVNDWWKNVHYVSKEEGTIVGAVYGGDLYDKTKKGTLAIDDGGWVYNNSGSSTSQILVTQTVSRDVKVIVTNDQIDEFVVQFDNMVVDRYDYAGKPLPFAPSSAGDSRVRIIRHQLSPDVRLFIADDEDSTVVPTYLFQDFGNISFTWDRVSNVWSGTPPSIPRQPHRVRFRRDRVAKTWTVISGSEVAMHMSQLGSQPLPDELLGRGDSKDSER